MSLSLPTLTFIPFIVLVLLVLLWRYTSPRLKAQVKVDIAEKTCHYSAVCSIPNPCLAPGYFPLYS